MARPDEPEEIKAPPLALAHCSVDDHCRALQDLEQLPFWWYLGISRLFGNFSIPFQDADGRWWYQVKPGLSWPADFLTPLPRGRRLPFRKAFLGYQHVVDNPADGDSHLVINTIADLSTFRTASLDTKRRNAVRKGLRSCELRRLAVYDRTAFEQCRLAWDDLTQRTGWKHKADPDVFDRTWRLLLDCPGVSILAGQNLETGKVAGFLVVKIIGDTAYVDTIASRTDEARNVNDALVYSFLTNARALPGVTKAHFAIRSYIQSLERFKVSMGFRPIPFPAITRLRWPVRLGLKWVYPGHYRRMIGHFADMEPSADSSGGSA